MTHQQVCLWLANKRYDRFGGSAVAVCGNLKSAVCPHSVRRDAARHPVAETAPMIRVSTSCLAKYGRNAVLITADHYEIVIDASVLSRASPVLDAFVEAAMTDQKATAAAAPAPGAGAWMMMDEVRVPIKDDHKSIVLECLNLLINESAVVVPVADAAMVRAVGSLAFKWQLSRIVTRCAVHLLSLQPHLSLDHVQQLASWHEIRMCVEAIGRDVLAAPLTRTELLTASEAVTETILRLPADIRRALFRRHDADRAADVQRAENERTRHAQLAASERAAHDKQLTETLATWKAVVVREARAVLVPSSSALATAGALPTIDTSGPSVPAPASSSSSGSSAAAAVAAGDDIKATVSKASLDELDRVLDRALTRAVSSLTPWLRVSSVKTNRRRLRVPQARGLLED